MDKVFVYFFVLKQSFRVCSTLLSFHLLKSRLLHLYRLNELITNDNYFVSCDIMVAKSCVFCCHNGNNQPKD